MRKDRFGLLEQVTTTATSGRFMRPDTPSRDDREFSGAAAHKGSFQFQRSPVKAGTRISLGLPSLPAGTEQSHRIARLPFGNPLPIPAACVILWLVETNDSAFCGLLGRWVRRSRH